MQVCDFEISDIHFTIQTFDISEGTRYRGEELVVEDRSQYLNIHQHITYECFLSCKKMVLFTDNGYEAYEKECVIVPPGKRHFVHESGDYYGFYFFMERVEGKNTGVYDKLCKCLCSEITVIPMNEEINFYTLQLKKCYVNYSNTNRIKLLYPLLLMETIGSIFPKETLNYTYLKSQRYYQVLLDNYIISFLNLDIKLEDLADELGLTSRRVSSLIKEHYGCTFTQLLIRRRLQAASMLLENSDMTNSEIAVTVGFENENYFYVCFKNEYNMTPQRYRQLYKKIDGSDDTGMVSDDLYEKQG